MCVIGHQHNNPYPSKQSPSSKLFDINRQPTPTSIKSEHRPSHHTTNTLISLSLVSTVLQHPHKLAPPSIKICTAQQQTSHSSHNLSNTPASLFDRVISTHLLIIAMAWKETGTTSHGGFAGFLVHTVIRFFQFVLALTVLGLYGQDIDGQRKYAGRADGRWVFAEVVAGLSAITALIFAVPFFKTYKAFGWDVLLL